MESAREAAKVAVAADQAGDLERADDLYMRAIELILAAAATASPAEREGIKKTAQVYMGRVEAIRQALAAAAPPARAPTTLPVGRGAWDRGNALFARAMGLDEAGESDAAVGLYGDAAEAYLAYASQAEAAGEGVGGGGGAGAPPGPAAARARVANILDRVASLRPPPAAAAPAALAAPAAPTGAAPPPAPRPRAAATSAAAATGSGVGGALTAEERRVLQATSVINGRTFLPWVDDDMREQFSFPHPFEDPDGLLPLAAKQKAKLGSWRRPSDLTPDGSKPQLIRELSALNVVQTLVGDCSFVSSVAIAAEYERRFGRRILTNIIYPQSPDGTPTYNPSGKYLVRLHASGVPRRVVVDDRLPSGPRGELLCAHSARRDEFWISILEKAFLKLCGGYDFPGSSSTSDLYALTGWLPETAHLDDKDLDTDRLWSRMRDGLSLGQCLLTMSTTAMGDDVAERVGLVPSHAYAVLDVREAGGVRLLQMKNPWAHLQWKGSYSAHDRARWTPELRATLPPGSFELAEKDNGVFWIDWESAKFVPPSFRQGFVSIRRFSGL